VQESKSPGPASAYRGAKTALRAVFRAGEDSTHDANVEGVE